MSDYPEWNGFPIGTLRTVDAIEVNQIERNKNQGNGLYLKRALPIGADHSFDMEYRISWDRSRTVDGLHVHPHVQIWYAKSGSYVHHFSGTDFTLEKGSLVIVPPYYPHFIDTRGDSELIRCEFSKDFILNGQDNEMQESMFNLIYLEPVLIETDIIKPYHYFHGAAAAELESIFDELLREYENGDCFSTTFVRAGVARLFAVIAREYQVEERDKVFSTYRKALNDALVYINDNYTKKIYLEDICKIALMSERSFFYLFKQIMGMSLNKYLQYLRVLRAQEMLRTTDRTQYDVAISCGFESTSYFHRVFKKITGERPGQYRAKYRDTVET